MRRVRSTDNARSPEWSNLIGGTMAGEFYAPVRVIVEDPKFPGAMSWNAESFEFPEQHPIAGPPYSRDIDRVILRLDPKTMPEAVRDRRPDGDYPVVVGPAVWQGPRVQHWVGRV